MASASLLAANKVAQPVFHCTTAAAVWEVDPDTWRMIIDTNVNGSQPLEYALPAAEAAQAAMDEAGWVI